MVLIERGRPNRVRILDLARDNWSASRSRILDPNATAPATGTTGWAYDAGSELLGGGVTGGVFHSYDPRRNEWGAHRVRARSPDGASIGDVSFHMHDYDPVNNVHVWISDGDKGRRTWAYRFRARSR